MKMGIRKEIDWQYVGALLAQEDHRAQAEFLKAFLKECGSWGTSWQLEQQLTRVNQELTSSERESLRALVYEEAVKP
jgi:hypothetical protein